MKDQPDLPDNDKPSKGFIQAVFEALIRVIGKLPAPLAYGGAIIIALLAVVIARGLIQNNILWAILSIFVIAIVGYIFLEVRGKNNRRRQAPRRAPGKIAGGGTKKIKFKQLKPESKKSVEFVDFITIGRNPESSLSFSENESRISWEHGIVRFYKGGYVYEHLSENHPTMIVSSDGGSRLMRPGKKERVALKNQDRLVFGNNEFIVTFDVAGTKIPVYIKTKE